MGKFLYTTLMYYSPEAVVELERGRQEVLGELEDLWLPLARDLVRSLTNERAQEYLVHGICRRLITIGRCIDNIFTIFPADRTNLLKQEERSDVQINLHAFFINLHGVPDNLAWIFVLENELAINPMRVGLFSRDKEMKSHLPKEVRVYLRSKTIKTWHQAYAKNYRDALAHRIPLYVPPAIYSPEHEQRYGELETEISAAMRQDDYNRVQTLTDEQDSIGGICPAFRQSFLDEDACSPMNLHSQIIADARTVMEIVNVLRPHLIRQSG